MNTETVAGKAVWAVRDQKADNITVGIAAEGVDAVREVTFTPISLWLRYVAKTIGKPVIVQCDGKARRVVGLGEE